MLRRSILRRLVLVLQPRSRAGEIRLAEAPVGSPDANGNLIGGLAFGHQIDPKLGPLVYNGGPVFLDGSRLLTRALLPGSPAINAGDPSAVGGVGSVPVNDERGAPFGRVFGGRIDMGAVECQPNPLPGDFNFNGVVDAADYSVWRDTLGSTTDLWADATGTGGVNQLDYEVWKENFGATLPPSARSGSGAGPERRSGEPGVGSADIGESFAAVAPVQAIVAAVQASVRPGVDVGAALASNQSASIGSVAAGGVSQIRIRRDAGAMYGGTAARQDRLLALWAVARDDDYGSRWAGPRNRADAYELLAEPAATTGDDGSVDADALDCALAGAGDLRLMIVN
jgi:hypothetical protein